MFQVRCRHSRRSPWVRFQWFRQQYLSPTSKTTLTISNTEKQKIWGRLSSSPQRCWIDAAFCSDACSRLLRLHYHGYWHDPSDLLKSSLWAHARWYDLCKDLRFSPHAGWPHHCPDLLRSLNACWPDWFGTICTICSDPCPDRFRGCWFKTVTYTCRFRWRCEPTLRFNCDMITSPT